MKVYLAGPIDRSEDSDAVAGDLLAACRKAIEMKPPVQPIVLFSPRRAFEVFGSPSIKECQSIKEINLTALMESDLVLVRYEPGVETWGTPLEVAVAFQAGKRVQLWTDDKGAMRGISALPLYLRACLSGHHGMAPTLDVGIDVVASRLMYGMYGEGK